MFHGNESETSYETPENKGQKTPPGPVPPNNDNPPPKQQTVNIHPCAAPIATISHIQVTVLTQSRAQL